MAPYPNALKKETCTTQWIATSIVVMLELMEASGDQWAGVSTFIPCLIDLKNLSPWSGLRKQ